MDKPTRNIGTLSKILILCKTDLHSDPRVLKQIKALGSKYHITTVGVTASSQTEVDVEFPIFQTLESTNKYKFIFQLVTKQFNKIYWTKQYKEALLKLSALNFDLIICNETELLPIANELATQQNVSIYLDLHEYYPVDKKNGKLSSLQAEYEHWLLTNHISKVNHFSTVSPSIVALYKQKYNLDCTLIDNACQYFDLLPSDVDPQHIKLVCHGAAIRSRKLEHMIDMMADLDERYTLDLYLMNTDTKYRKELESRTTKFPKGKVNIYPGINFCDIQRTINKYDIGVYNLYPTHLNNKLALPNKVFEFIQARLAIVVGPTPDISELVKKYNIGCVAEKFTSGSIAEAVKNISVSDIEAFKKNTNKAARERNSEKNINQIREIVSKLTD